MLAGYQGMLERKGVMDCEERLFLYKSADLLADNYAVAEATRNKTNEHTRRLHLVLAGNAPSRTVKQSGENGERNSIGLQESGGGTRRAHIRKSGVECSDFAVNVLLAGTVLMA